jgi:glycosyltransferase involved in cell wall biosynthesis
MTRAVQVLDKLPTTQQSRVLEDCTLIVPPTDVQNPELSIVIPALDEELSIGRFVGWCKEGILAAGIRAEILIVDSSTDRTAEIAVAHGARVLKTPKRGLGRAYIDAIPYIRGRYVLMGDADCTYDFRDIGAFVGQFRSGAEFIMGSRFKGSIEEGAMPPLHRYFGTPLITFILNVMFGTRFSDINCGMRGITLEALKRAKLASQSWEYASEMILKSVHLGLRTSEVPVRFLKDPEGRLSHLVRAGWMTPWKAGWINLKAMFVFGADFFLMAPGLTLFVFGFPPLCLLLFGPVTMHGVTLSINSMLLFLVAAISGLQLFLIGAFAQSLYDPVGMKRRRWLAILPYTRTTLLSAVILLSGLVLVGRFAIDFAAQGYRFTETLVAANHRAIFGLFLIMSAIIVFVSMLLVHAIGYYVPLDALGTAEARKPAGQT